MMRSLRAWLVVLVVAYPVLAGYGGPDPFHVAPLRPSGGNYAPGEWVVSSALASKDEITVVVMASWCPHCARMIDQLAESGSARSRVDMVLFFDDENPGGMRQGAFLAHPEKLAGRNLPYYFAKKREFAGLYEGFPTILACTRAGCTRRSRADIGLP